MIIVNAKFQVKPESKADFLADIKVLIAASQKEAGNLAYDLYQSIEDEFSFVMVENWQDQAAGQAHNQSAPFIAFSQKVPEYLAAKPEIQISMAK